MEREKVVFIVGGAGYVGEMLAESFAARDDVGKVVVLDKEAQSDYSKKIPKLIYIKANMSDKNWLEEVARYEPEVVVHTAWQIRAMYGEAPKQWLWNVEGSNNVFDFTLNLPSVKKFIYFSTASSYSARESNTFDHLFTEDEGFRHDDYIYAYEKKITEENLEVIYNQLKKEGKQLPQVTVFRPAAITGPRGRYMRIRFGLQSVLQGNLKGGLINRIITLLTSFVPVTKGWVRQFIHEDDVNDAVTKVIFENQDWEYEVFNLVPVSEAVYPDDMAEAVNKKKVTIYPWMVRLAFWFFWHATRGRVPTCPHSWRFYSYPLLMSGEKLQHFYKCKYTSKNAFHYTNGRYENLVPEHNRRHNNVVIEK